MTSEQIDGKINELEAEIRSAEIRIGYWRQEIDELKSSKRRAENGEPALIEEPPDPHAWHR